MLMKNLKSAAWVLAPALAFAVAQPALARDGYRHHRRGNGDDAAIAIGAGVVGLALGAAIASSGRDRDRDYYYDDRDNYNGGGYYPQRSYYYQSYPQYHAYPAYNYGYRRDWRGHGRHRDGSRHHRRHWRY